MSPSSESDRIEPKPIPATEAPEAPAQVVVPQLPKAAPEKVPTVVDEPKVKKTPRRPTSVNGEKPSAVASTPVVLPSPAALEPSAVHERRRPGRPPSAADKATACIYFRDGKTLDRVKEITKDRDSSLSKAVNQFIDALIAAVDAEPETRQFKMNFTLYL